MKYVISFLIGIGVVFATINNRFGDISNVIISQSTEAINLCIYLAGMMALWSGLMAIAEKSGLVLIIKKILSPITNFLFNDLHKNGKALSLITMNITANLLGLGNASTPLGLAAMKEIEKEKGESREAANAMIMLVTLNATSLQLIPTTVIALRTRHGSLNPTEIIPGVWIVSLTCAFCAIFIAKIFMKRKGHKHELQ